MSEHTVPVDIATIRYIDVEDYRVRTAEFQDNEDRYAATVVAYGGVEVDDAPIETAAESRYIASAFAVEAYEDR